MQTTRVTALAWILALAACTTDDAPTEPAVAPGFDPLPASAAIAFYSNRDGTDTQIYVANADGSGVTRIASGISPAWSPDGARLAFWRGGGIYIAGADGSNVALYYRGLAFTPSWTPDGRSVIFGARRDHTRIFIATGAESVPRQLIPDKVDAVLADYYDGDPVWRPGR